MTGEAMPGDGDDVLRLLTSAHELAGQRGVMLRVETDMAETFYVEECDANLIVHDRGETWFFVQTHHETNCHGMRQGPWSCALTERFGWCGNSSMAS
jgi:hypothetical protein